MLWIPEGGVESRDLVCLAIAFWRKNLVFRSSFTHSLSHLAALPGGKNLLAGQIAHAGGGRGYISLIFSLKDNLSRFSQSNFQRLTT